MVYKLINYDWYPALGYPQTQSGCSYFIMRDFAYVNSHGNTTRS